MGFNSFNTNPMNVPLRKTFVSNGQIGGRRNIEDIKQEMLDTTRPELKESYISKYHREDDKMELPFNSNGNRAMEQRNTIENMRNLSRGL